MKTAFARRWPAVRARWVAPLLPAFALWSPALAQQPYGKPYTDPYRSGPTRPLDGSPRGGVYSSQPAPSYEAAPRGLGSNGPGADAPAIWRGLYAGVQVGHRWTSTEAPGSGFATLSPRGPQFGAHLGHNFQTGNIVYGLEGDLMLGSASASSTSAGSTFSIKDSWTSSLRARAGYTVGPALLYATGGIAVAGQDTTWKAGALSASMTDARVGYVLGAGLEMQLTQQLTARIEGLHYGYKDQALNLSAASQTIKQDSNVLRAGVSYRFN